MKRLLLLLLALVPAAAPAQYTDSLGYSYNNMMSATIGTYLNGQSNMFYARQALYRSMRTAGPDPQETRGRALIRSGAATMAFPTRPFPLAKWLDAWGAGDPQKRERAAREWEFQRAIWADEIRARGAKPGDMAQMMALAFVACVEAITGQKVSNVGFRKETEEFRKVWIKDPFYQGRSAVSKQELYEDSMLTGSYALYLRRMAHKGSPAGDVDKARSAAGGFLDKWCVGKTPAAIKAFANYLGPAPKKAVTEVAPAVPSAPQTPPVAEMTFEEAARVTGYTPTESTLADRSFAANVADPARREDAARIVRAILDAAHRSMARSKQANLPMDNVARAMALSLTGSYQIALAQPGQKVGFGKPAFTGAQINALSRQIAINLASNEGFRKLGDREKQEMAESLLLVPSMSMIIYNGALEKGDEAAQGRARDMARAQFVKLFGIEPEKVRFTDNGARAIADDRG